MPRYVSKEGVFHPAKERVGLKNFGKPFKDEKTGEMINTGDDYIYEGPDRAALFEIWKNDHDATTLGYNFRMDSDLLDFIRQKGFKDMAAYLKYVGYDETKADQIFNDKAAIVNKHELPNRIKAIQNLGGGADLSGQGNDIYGGFGKPEDVRV